MLSRKRTLLLFLLSSLLISSCEEDETLVVGQEPDPVEMPAEDPTTADLTLVFSQIFGGSQDDTFQDIIVTSDGGYMALGYSQSVDGDIVDNAEQVNKYWLVKTDSEGIIQWSKTYGGTDDDRGEHLIQTNDGGYLLAGSSTSSDGDVTQNAGFYDHWLVKLEDFWMFQLLEEPVMMALQAQIPLLMKKNRERYCMALESFGAIN